MQIQRLIMKKTLSLILVFLLCSQCVGCTVIEKVKSTASNAKDSVITWYNNIDKEKFRQGWDYVVNLTSSTYATVASGEYVASVATALNDFTISMNNAYSTVRGVAQEAGFVAEKWAAGTFNIDSIANNSDYVATVTNDNGPIDIKTNYGENAQLKYYSTASGSANAQARLSSEAIDLLKQYKEYQTTVENPLSWSDYLDEIGMDPDTRNTLLNAEYYGMTRIIPTDQLAEATAYIEGRIDTLSGINGEASALSLEAYKDTLNNLRDHLQAPDGTSSKPLTNQDLQAIAELTQTGEFKPEDFGLKLTQIITPKYILKQSIGTGLTAAAISAAFEVGPDLISVIVKAAKEGGFDKEDLKKLGIDGLLSASEGFVQGSLSSAIIIMCKSGYFGEALLDASPSVVATLTVLVIEAVKYGYYLAKGDITSNDYGNLMAERILIAAITLPTATALTAFLGGTQLAGLAGCLAGSVIAVVGFNAAKNLTLEIKNGGGFAAIVPKGVIDTIDVAKDAIVSLNLKEKVSSFKDYAISTTKDGLIIIKSIVGA